MVKKYRELKTTPQELKLWQDVGTLYYDVTERNRVATKRDIDRVKKLVAGGGCLFRQLFYQRVT